MLISVQDRNFSGLIIKQTEEEVIMYLKPFDMKKMVRIKDGNYLFFHPTELPKYLNA